jgi:hypothetical protein
MAKLKNLLTALAKPWKESGPSESNSRTRYGVAEIIKLEKELDNARMQIVVLSVAYELLNENYQELQSKFQ